MLRRVLFFALGAFLMTTSAIETLAGEPIRWRDQTVGRLEFPAPTGSAWAREKQQHGYAYNRLEHNWLGAAKRLLYVQVLRNSYPADMADWTEREIADDFRDNEEMGMQVMGVQTGMYRFLSLVRGQETHSGRTLHTMKMLMEGGRAVGWRLHRQELYLLFPRDHDRTREFYVFVIGDFCMPRNCNERGLSVAEVLPMLDQLRLHDGGK